MENKTEFKKEQIIIDATEGVVGRVASYAAKQALLGKKVIVVNCSSALLTGGRRMVIRKYHEARIRGGTSLNGPHFPKHPFRIMKRTIRGMLSYTQQRGLDALKSIICYDGLPKEYENEKKISLIVAKKVKTMTLDDLSKEI